MVRPRGQGQLAAADVGGDLVVEGSVQGDSFGEIGGTDRWVWQDNHEQDSEC